MKAECSEECMQAPWRHGLGRVWRSPTWRWTMVLVLVALGTWLLWVQREAAASHMGADAPDVPDAQALRAQAAWAGMRVEAPREMALLQRWPARLVPQQRWVLKAPSDAQVVLSQLTQGRDVGQGALLLRLHDAALAAEHRATARKIARLRLQLAGTPAEAPEVLRADYNASRLRTELSRLHAEADTQRGLLDKGLVPRMELQLLEQRAQDTSAQLATATRELASARALAQLARADASSELAGLLEQERTQAARLAALEVRAPFAGRLAWVAPGLQQDVKRGTELALLESTGAPAAEMRLVRSAELERLFAPGTPLTLQPRAGMASESPNSSFSSWALPDTAAQGREAVVRALAGANTASEEAAAPSASPLVVVQLALRPDAPPQQSAPAPALPIAWQADAEADAWLARRVPVFHLPASAVRRWQGRSFVYVRSAEKGDWVRREVDGCADGQGGFLVAEGLRRGETVALP